MMLEVPAKETSATFCTPKANPCGHYSLRHSRSSVGVSLMGMWFHKSLALENVKFVKLPLEDSDGCMLIYKRLRQRVVSLFVLRPTAFPLHLLPGFIMC